MFFKPDPHADKNITNIACWCTFVFWGVVLLINSFYESFFNKPFISSSLTILYSSLAIFFVTDLLLKFFKQKKQT